MSNLYEVEYTYRGYVLLDKPATREGDFDEFACEIVRDTFEPGIDYHRVTKVPKKVDENELVYHRGSRDIKLCEVFND